MSLARKLMLRCCIVVGTVLATVPLTVTAQAAEPQDHWQYTIRPGDDLWTLAKDFCGSARLAEQLARYNNLPNAAAVRAGTRIQIPVAWLVFAPAEAELLDLTGEVYFLTNGLTETEPRAARIGQGLPMGSLIVTEDGSALIAFADGSTLTIQQNSRVLFNKLTAFGPAGMVDTHLRFAYGRGTTRVQEQNRGDRFRIETPEGVAAVRGTVFRVGYNDELATTETLEGEVAFISPQTELDVPQGFGVAAKAGALTKETLLPAPEFYAQESIGTGEQVSWRGVVGAERYAITWARASAPEVPVATSYHDDTSAAVNLAPGRYLGSVRGISAANIEGQDGQTELTVLGVAPRPEDTRTDPMLPALLRWQFDTQASAGNDFEVELTNADTLAQVLHATRQSSLALDLPPGRYSYRVRTQQSSWSEPHEFVRLPQTPQGLSIERKRRTLNLAWDRASAEETYRIEITAPGGDVSIVETANNQAIIDVDTFGTHVIHLASVQNSLQSKPTVQEETVARRPWWLLALLVIFVL